MQTIASDLFLPPDLVTGLRIPHVSRFGAQLRSAIFIEGKRISKSHLGGYVF
ncbi:hypothetical protein [Tateyamaria pelophila]|uniref:hypothetical protein n=1 Tax=Tateyamaria pelophila TaxID=328415 RepID=UPI001CBCD3D0|nr:hypothetical protein [Tateyamaria pelophila]